jgi:hypothetical protein
VRRLRHCAVQRLDLRGRRRTPDPRTLLMVMSEPRKVSEAFPRCSE